MSVEGMIAGTTAGPWTEAWGWCGGFSSGSAPDTISPKSIRSPGVPMATPVKASSGNAPLTLIFRSYFFVLENKECRHWDRSAAANLDEITVQNLSSRPLSLSCWYLGRKFRTTFQYPSSTDQENVICVKRARYPTLDALPTTSYSHLTCYDALGGHHNTFQSSFWTPETIFFALSARHAPVYILNLRILSSDDDDTDWDVSCIVRASVFPRLEGDEACEIVKIGRNTTAHELCKHKRQCLRPYWELQLLRDLGKSAPPTKILPLNNQQDTRSDGTSVRPTDGALIRHRFICRYISEI